MIGIIDSFPHTAILAFYDIGPKFEESLKTCFESGTCRKKLPTKVCQKRQRKSSSANDFCDFLHARGATARLPLE
jgi:hypothetical protein